MRKRRRNDRNRVRDTRAKVRSGADVPPARQRDDGVTTAPDRQSESGGRLASREIGDVANELGDLHGLRKMQIEARGKRLCTMLVGYQRAQRDRWNVSHAAGEAADPANQTVPV